MAPQRGFTVLVATDGSPDARTALSAAIAFPWPARSRAAGVVARTTAMVGGDWSAHLWEALEGEREKVARGALRALRRRWPDAEVRVTAYPAVEGILAEARRTRASAIVLGSRGHGPIGRLLLGSVSRDVVRRAPCATLVIKAAARTMRRFVIGVDGSANARRAVAFLARLAVPRGSQATVVSVVESLRVPSTGPLPGGVRGAVTRQVRSMEAAAVARARRHISAAARELRRAGWRTREIVRIGAPLAGMLAVGANAHCLVVGARGVSGLERLLLGSVAQGLLNRARRAVLVVR